MGQPDTLVAGNMMGKSCAYLPGCVMQFGVRNEPSGHPWDGSLAQLHWFPCSWGAGAGHQHDSSVCPQGSLSSSSELILERERVSRQIYNRAEHWIPLHHVFSADGRSA